jgi:excisionase family DNA binding protein
VKVRTKKDSRVTREAAPEENGEFLTVEEVAAWLRVSPAWIRDHATRKKPHLPVVRLGKLMRFRRLEIQDWLKRQGIG